MREKSGVLRGKTRFDEYRVVTNLTLDRAAIGIAKHYEMQIKAVEEFCLGRIPHTIVIVWTGAELKVKISEDSDLGSIRPNLHTAVYDDTADQISSPNSCQIANFDAIPAPS